MDVIENSPPPLVPFSSSISSIPSVIPTVASSVPIKKRPASPLKEAELVTDDLGVVTVEVVAGDEAKRIKVSFLFKSIYNILVKYLDSNYILFNRIVQ